MGNCPIFIRGKKLGLIRTMRSHCEQEPFCDGLSCPYVPNDLIEPVIEVDPRDLIQDAALTEISGQATLAVIAAATSK